MYTVGPLPAVKPTGAIVLLTRLARAAHRRAMSLSAAYLVAG